MSNRLSVRLSTILFIVLITLLLVTPLWQIAGLPGDTHDGWAHLHRSVALHRSIEQGVFWPRWFPYPDIYNGLGEPTLHHYSPGFYWLTALAHRAGLRLDHSFKLVVTVVLVLSGLGVYAWLRHAFSQAASLVGAYFYLLHPHILTRSVYYVGDYPRLLAYLLLPVCLWACTALYMQSRVRYWVAMTVSLAAVVFSHTLMAILVSTILLLYTLLLAAGYRRPGGLLRCTGAVLLVALMSAIFWLPAIVDSSLLHIENLRQGNFHFSGNFLSWCEFTRFQTPVLDGVPSIPPPPVNKLGLDAATWLALAAGLVSALFAARKELRFWGIAGIAFAAAALALTLRVSEPLWQTVPGLSLFQFPYRFLSIAPLGLLPAAALAVDVWPAGRRWLPSIALMIVSFLVLFPYLFPAHTSFVWPVKAETAESTHLLWLRNRMLGTTGSDEFLVRGADMDIISGKKQEPSATHLTWHSPHEATASLSGQSEPVLLRMHFHPGWDAGERATLTSGPAGWMQVSELIDPDRPLAIRWKGTASQHWGERLSLTGLVLFMAVILYNSPWGREGKRRRKEGGSGHCSQRAASQSTTHTLAAMGGCALLLLAVRGTLHHTGLGPYLPPSEQAKLAFSMEGHPIALGDDRRPQVTFLGWELRSSELFRPGGMVRVRLHWQPNERINEELFSFVHLYTPSSMKSWAVENARMERPSSTLWDPEKRYIEDIRLLLPFDLPPANYSLVAGMVSLSGKRLTVLGSSDNLLYLRSLNVTPARLGCMQMEQPSVSARAATDDGLRLQGYDLLQAASPPTLRLFWETKDKVSADWITYIHLHDTGGERLAQFDGPPLAGLVPTSQWHTDALYIDRRELDLPAAIEYGDYQLRIGLYDRVSGERLSFQPDDDMHDDFHDGQLLVPLTVADPGNSSD